MKKLKIGYFADGPWSHQALTRLLLDNTLQIAFVCARFDNPDPILKAKAAEKNNETTLYCDCKAVFSTQAVTTKFSS